MTADKVTLKTVGGRMTVVPHAGATFKALCDCAVDHFDLDPASLRLVYNGQTLVAPDAKVDGNNATTVASESPVVPPGSVVVVVGVRSLLRTPSSSVSMGSMTQTNDSLLGAPPARDTPPPVGASTPLTPPSAPTPQRSPRLAAQAPRSPVPKFVIVGSIDGSSPGQERVKQAGNGPLVYPHAPDGLRGIAERVNRSTRTLEKYEAMSGHATIREIRKIALADPTHEKLRLVFEQAQRVAPEFVTMVQENKQLFLDVMNDTPPMVPLREVMSEMPNTNDLVNVVANLFAGLDAESTDLDLSSRGGGAGIVTIGDPMLGFTVPMHEDDLDEAELAEELEAELQDMLEAEVVDDMMVASLHSRLAQLYGKREGTSLDFALVTKHHMEACKRVFRLAPEGNSETDAIDPSESLLGGVIQSFGSTIFGSAMEFFSRYISPPNSPSAPGSKKTIKQESVVTPDSGRSSPTSALLPDEDATQTATLSVLREAVPETPAEREQHRAQSLENIFDLTLRYNRFLSSLINNFGSSSHPARAEEQEADNATDRGQQVREGEPSVLLLPRAPRTESSWQDPVAGESRQQSSSSSRASHARDLIFADIIPSPSFPRQVDFETSLAEEKEQLLSAAKTLNTTIVLVTPSESHTMGSLLVLLHPDGTITATVSPHNAEYMKQAASLLIKPPAEALLPQPNGQPATISRPLRTLWQDRCHDLYRALWAPIANQFVLPPLPTAPDGKQTSTQKSPAAEDAAAATEAPAATAATVPVPAVHYILPSTFRHHALPLNSMMDSKGHPIALQVAFSQSTSIEAFRRSLSMAENPSTSSTVIVPCHTSASASMAAGAPRSSSVGQPPWLSRNLKKIIGAEIASSSLKDPALESNASIVHLLSANSCRPAGSANGEGSTPVLLPPAATAAPAAEINSSGNEQTFRVRATVLISEIPTTALLHETEQLGKRSLILPVLSTLNLGNLPAPSGRDLLSSPATEGSAAPTSPAPVAEWYPYETFRGLYLGLTQGLSLSHALRRGVVECYKAFPEEPWKWGEYCVINNPGPLPALAARAHRLREELQTERRSQAQREVIRGSREFRYLSTHGVGPLFEHMLQSLLVLRPEGYDAVLDSLIRHLEDNYEAYEAECQATLQQSLRAASNSTPPNSSSAQAHPASSTGEGASPPAASIRQSDPSPPKPPSGEPSPARAPRRGY